MECACGAAIQPIETYELSRCFPVLVPGPYLEPCRCPRCITCGKVLDSAHRCQTLFCPLEGATIFEPDYGSVPTTEPSPQLKPRPDWFRKIG